jgi:hypothetical protein
MMNELTVFQAPTRSKVGCKAEILVEILTGITKNGLRMKPSCVHGIHASTVPTFWPTRDLSGCWIGILSVAISGIPYPARLLHVESSKVNLLLLIPSLYSVSTAVCDRRNNTEKIVFVVAIHCFHPCIRFVAMAIPQLLNRLLPCLGYHHLFMVFLIMEIILLCKINLIDVCTATEVTSILTSRLYVDIFIGKLNIHYFLQLQSSRPFTYQYRTFQYNVTI